MRILHFKLLISLFGISPLLKFGAVKCHGQKAPGHITEEFTGEHMHLADESSFGYPPSHSKKEERIQASIIPVVHGADDARSPPRTHIRAEVRLHVADPPQQRIPQEDLLRATSIVMEYDEDTRKYFHPKDNNEHRIRHGLHRALPPRRLPDAANDAPLEEAVSDAGTAKPSVRLSVPVRAFVYGSRRPNVLPRRRIQDVNTLHALQNDSWISLHSPVKIYIPVRYQDNEVPANPASGDCVRCSADLTLTAARGESRAPVPVPAISVCSRLARKRGRMNVAVTSGPRPGVLVPEGHYPVELIIWKSGGQVYSCKYTLTVLVKQCQDVSSPEGGSVDCSNGTTWGSKCHFTCHAGHVIQGHSTLLCEGSVQKVSWSAPFPTCKKDSNKGVLPAVKGLPCLKLKQPQNGAVVCDSNGKELYLDGSVCQFFCYPGFLIDQVSSGSSMVVCKNGQWTPTDTVTCVAAYCSQPRWPKDGRVKCDQEGSKDSSFRDKYPNGTTCHFQCGIGHVIPTSQLVHSSVVCRAPAWNDTSIPECKRVVPPKSGPGDCVNETLTVGEGLTTLLSFDRLPKFTAQGGTSLTTTCSLEGKDLGKGVHYNFCEATDPELRITTTCRYYVHVKERPRPRPHPRDCKNVTALAGSDGTFEVRAARFLLKKGRASPKVMLRGNCTHSGKLVAGTYINKCVATDPELNVTGTCIYAITVKERTCPLPPSNPHSNVECDNLAEGSFPPKTVCKYSCDEGYAPRSSLGKRMTTLCTAGLTWRPSTPPSCARAIPPRPRRGECEFQTLYLPEDEAFVKYRIPRFKSSIKGSKVRVRCSLNRTLPLGDYLNVCEARDKELGITSSCKYNISVKARGCRLLPSIPGGSVSCSEPPVGHIVPVGAACTYQCEAGQVIPTDLLPYAEKTCSDQGLWNNTVQPSCLPQIPPTIMEDSCLNRSMVVREISVFRVPVPEFRSEGGSNLNVTCDPEEIVEEYGVHEVACTAYDPHLRVSASCVYLLDIQDPSEEEELHREEVECLLPAFIENGKIRCNSSENELLLQHSICEVVCDQDYVVPNRQLHLSVAVCLLNSEWNISRFAECIKSEVPIGNPGCKDLVLEIPDLKEVSVPLPQFLTSRNSTAEVTCIPEVIADYGSYQVSCKALDEDLGTSSECSFNISIQNPSVEEESFTSTTEPTVTTENEIIHESTFQPCKSLRMPARSGVECLSEEGRERCRVTCDEGYRFHSNYLLKDGWIECDGTDGLWDFERTYHTSVLPECLGHSQGLALRVWLGFKAAVEQCGEGLEVQYKSTIQDLLLTLNDMCSVLDCKSSLGVNCSHDSRKNRIVLAVNWTLQASFDPDQYEDHDVPDAETQLEHVLEITQKAVTTEEWFRKELLQTGIELWQDSFSRGHMVLVCPKGYAVDMTDTCVECPSGTMESNAECVTCSMGTFQLLPGQTICETCPQNVTFFRGNIPRSCAG